MFVGNQKSIERLDRMLARHLVGQAYLFSGPEAVGKFLAAKIFAQAVIEDYSALKFDWEEGKMNHPDCLVLEPEVEEKKGVRKIKDISIETIREAQHQLALFPLIGKKRVMIVRDAHRLTVAAQNALLKTLEEPAETAVLILVTHDSSQLLSTIHSRCQTISFSLVAVDDLSQIPCWVECPAQIRQVIRQLAFGRPGQVIELIRNDEEREYWSELMKSSRMIDQWGITERLTFSERISKDAKRVDDFLHLWQWLVREEAIKSQSWHQKARLLRMIGMVQKILETTNVNPRLTLDNLMLEV